VVAEPQCSGELVAHVSPTFTNEISATGFRDWHQRGAGLDPTRFGGEARTQNFADILKIPNPFNAENWPNFGNIGFNAGGETPYYLISSFFTVEDNATKVIGKHEMAFGLQFRYEMTARNNPLTANLDFGTGNVALRSGFPDERAAGVAADRLWSGESVHRRRDLFRRFRTSVDLHAEE
jgi:hypothetical protein